MKNEYLEKFEKYLKLAGYSPLTISRYLKVLIDFLNIYPTPEKATTQNLIDFALTKPSNAYRKQAQGVFKHFFKTIVPKKEILTLLPSIKNQKKIPQILTTSEIKLILDKTKNLKHLAMLHLIYYSAIRSSEFINLKIENVNGTDFEIHIQNGKGAKDRIIPIPEETIILLRKYYKKYKPKMYLFNGQIKVHRYTSESLQKVVKQAVRRAHILKNISPHSLRHSRATHLITNGVDIKTVQEFLGHNSIKTTEAYLHICKHQMKRSIVLADETIRLKAA